MTDPTTRHTFKDAHLLRLALTHPSCERPEGNNQRLEFLGDAVLDLVVAEQLYRRFPEADEGALDRARASLVNGKSIARVATRQELGRYLEVSQAHREHHPEPSQAMLEDALEALIGAVYLDGGLAAARAAIEHLFGPELAAARPEDARKNPKGQLQEWSQKHHQGAVPTYQDLPPEGPEHERTYHAAVWLDAQELGRGCGPSKRAAEVAAAEAALRSLGDAPSPGAL